ncbi:hypothetical protein FT663_04038 [Candidozyma haemuli var. vulneris]|uniref:peptidylprolyl isomerase n=1 Tax=Candidozyma haemuli TaxID=45357 RepID=A0A2V1ANU2_9ASCO|nr:hypothetical protein CXQ85_003364 [[Candida] haemuloni]KAF3987217.1 hypothetical protein FT662_04119 [[Candida] haemuloni var. vulneris]KAF3988426.1 hypothetical protein FT663_04038 [[Candida] haemuloni var. vulneris]PVH19518.1 hypothetical protein CXQ85_003364 [[Candida] haemuloni]
MKVEEVLPKVYLDISVGEREVGRIVAELFVSKAPSTTAAFLEQLDSYKGHGFNRIIKNFMIQCDNGNIDESEKLPEENKEEPFEQPFLLALAGQSVSQFFITTYKSQHLSGLHTCFGRVLKGKSVIREIENVQTDKEHAPLESDPVIIKDCGQWEEGDPVPIFNACYDEIAGDIYEEYPDDDDHIDKESSASALKAATRIKNAGGELLKSGEPQKASFKFRKAMRYLTEYFPDQDEEPEFYAKYTDLKKKIYLNFSLATLKLKQYSRCLDYCNYLFEMKITPQEKAKTLFRAGSAKIELREYKEAIRTLEEAQKLVPEDAGIKKELTRAEEQLEASKKAERAKYAKFFG